jgi:response regulator RpfG family c-di-GMP phosphodiesterase
MKKHTLFGEEALRITEQKLGQSTFLRHAREIAGSHQEKWDGSGYPRGLKGEAIPVSGRLMALADVYDALISKRVYKPPFPHAKAVQIIQEGRGTHFDPDVVEAFLALEDTFRNIALTFADCDEEREALGGAKATDAALGGGVTRVLLAEDNPINREIMLSQLTALGYTVAEAASGKEALSKYQAGPYNLVLTDIEMPEMDGYRLAAEIRRLEQDGRPRTPILAITASDFDLDEGKARSAGLDGYMLKPLDPRVLTKKLADIFREAENAQKP